MNQNFMWGFIKAADSLGVGEFVRDYKKRQAQENPKGPLNKETLEAKKRQQAFTPIAEATSRLNKGRVRAGMEGYRQNSPFAAARPEFKPYSDSRPPWRTPTSSSSFVRQGTRPKEQFAEAPVGGPLRNPPPPAPKTKPQEQFAKAPVGGPLRNPPKAAPAPAPAPAQRTVQNSGTVSTPRNAQPGRPAAPRQAYPTGTPYANRRAEIAAAMKAKGGYTLQRGDTLSSLAKKHGTTVSALMASNKHVSDANRVYAGGRLNLGNSQARPAVNVAKKSRPLPKMAIPKARSDMVSYGTKAPKITQKARSTA